MTASQSAYVTRRTPENSTWYQAHLMTFLGTTAQTGGSYALLEVNGHSGFEPPAHVHTREDEIYFLLDGAATFSAGDTRDKATAGDCVFLPRYVEHSFKIEAGEARTLIFLLPSDMEGYFRELSQPAQSLTLPPPPDKVYDMERLMDANARYGLYFTSMGAPHPAPEMEKRDAHRVKITPGGTGTTHNVLGVPISILIDPDHTDGSFTLWEMSVPPESGPPLHIHRHEDEAFYVLEGQMTFYLGDDKITGEPGTYVHLPKGTPHTFNNHTSATARVLGMANPGGNIRNFYEAMGRMPSDGPPDIALATRICENHGITLLL